MCGGAFVVTVGVVLRPAVEVGRGASARRDGVLVAAGRVAARSTWRSSSIRSAITMCLFVTGIGTLIHLYAIGYMHGDPKFSKFFLYLNLFAFSMLMLVLGENMLVTFLGWEGVGTC